MNKIFSMFVVLGLVALALSACGRSEDPRPVPIPPAVGNEPKEAALPVAPPPRAKKR